MKVALFIPCYVDQFYPNVAIATLELLNKLGVEVEYPLNQTCCGQPMANSGCEKDALGASQVYFENFKGYDYIVGPSGSCVLHVRDHLSMIGKSEEILHVQNHTYELCEFLNDVLKVKTLDATFPHKVGLHQSCHGLRGMHLGKPSEIVAPPFSKVKTLLEMVQDIELVDLEREDECCGFGGTFCVSEEAISSSMGNDRVDDHLKNGAAVITSTDMSCLMHLDGIIKRRALNIQVKHIAEILNANAS